MSTTLKPEMEAQIEALAERLALTDPDAHERVLKWPWMTWTQKFLH